MHLEVVIGLVLALACAASASLSGLWKRKGALQAGDVDVRQPVKTAATLFQSKWFLIGWVVAVIAWLLHVGALALAPLSLAQAVIAGGLVLLGVLAERFFDFQLTRRQWWGLGIVALGMAVLAATAHSEKNHASYPIIAIAAFETAAVGIGVAFVLSCRIRRLEARRGVLLAVGAGFLFGVSDVSIKAVTSGSHGLLGVVGPWTLIGIVAAVIAFYASARSLQIGDGLAVLTATAAAANGLGIVAGVVVFGDPLGNDVPSIVARVFAFCLVIVAVGLFPAPVRAQQEVRNQGEEATQSEESQHAAFTREPAMAQEPS